MTSIINIKTIEAHKKGITKVSIFPSGNIISISNDLSINIWDNNFNLIQQIDNAHEEYLTYVEIENENNFVTCSDDRSIKFWNKQYNIFTLKENIINAHQSGITKVIFIKNKQNLISCSEDETIKVWEKKNKINKYQCVNIIQLPGWVFSIMDIPDKNLLLVAGPFLGIFFYNNIHFNINFSIKNANCRTNNSVERIDNDRIIVGGRKDCIIKILSISLKKVIKEINNKTHCWGVLVIKNKNIFIVGGYNSIDIKVYNSESYELINVLKNAHNRGIYGFTFLNNKNFISYSLDCLIKIWEIQ